MAKPRSVPTVPTFNPRGGPYPLPKSALGPVYHVFLTPLKPHWTWLIHLCLHAFPQRGLLCCTVMILILSDPHNFLSRPGWTLLLLKSSWNTALWDLSQCLTKIQHIIYLNVLLSPPFTNNKLWLLKRELGKLVWTPAADRRNLKGAAKESSWASKVPSGRATCEDLLSFSRSPHAVRLTLSLTLSLEGILTPTYPTTENCLRRNWWGREGRKYVRN